MNSVKRRVIRARHRYKHAPTRKNKRSLIIALSALAALIGIGAARTFVSGKHTGEYLAQRSRKRTAYGPSHHHFKTRNRLKVAVGLNSYTSRIRCRPEMFNQRLKTLKQRIRSQCNVVQTHTFRNAAQGTVYVHYVIETGKLRYHDDLELMYAPDKGDIHLRSASRVGLYDFGVNKRRIQTICQPC